MANEIMEVMTSSIKTMDSYQAAIEALQQKVKDNFINGIDYGVIPGTDKPTLLKPGAEKLILLLGLKCEFEIINSQVDFDNGFFYYQIKCILSKLRDDGGEVVITNGYGSANTQESKYRKQDSYTLDNTVLKMAEKRAVVDAALHAGALSNIFTQDVEDMDLNGDRVSGYKKTYTDKSGTITTAQSKRMYAIAGGNKGLIDEVLEKHGYKGKSSSDVNKLDYEKICNEIEARVKGANGAKDTSEKSEVDPEEAALDAFMENIPF